MMHALMGRVVLVHKVFKRHCSGNGIKSWDAVPANGRPGWVVGERWLQVGSAYDSAYDGRVWCPRKGCATHCLLVAYWPSMKPVRVLDDGYEIAHRTIYPYRTLFPWSLGSRELLRKEMSDWPRDSKGRWVKKEKE